MHIFFFLSNLSHGVVDVLKRLARTRTGHVVEDDAHQTHDAHAENALPSHGLQGRHLVLGQKLLFNHHLQCDDDLLGGKKI